RDTVQARVSRTRSEWWIKGNPRRQFAGDQPPPRGDLSEVLPDVLAGDLGEVRAGLEGNQLAVRPDRAEQPAGQRAGARARLEDPGAGEDVGVGEDLRGVLRVDDRGAALHRQRVVGE